MAKVFRFLCERGCRGLYLNAFDGKLRDCSLIPKRQGIRSNFPLICIFTLILFEDEASLW